MFAYWNHIYWMHSVRWGRRPWTTRTILMTLSCIQNNEGWFFAARARNAMCLESSLCRYGQKRLMTLVIWQASSCRREERKSMRYVLQMDLTWNTAVDSAAQVSIYFLMAELLPTYLSFPHVDYPNSAGSCIVLYSLYLEITLPNRVTEVYKWVTPPTGPRYNMPGFVGKMGYKATCIT